MKQEELREELCCKLAQLQMLKERWDRCARSVHLPQTDRRLARLKAREVDEKIWHLQIALANE